jgi:hypothetical protein
MGLDHALEMVLSQSMKTIFSITTLCLLALSSGCNRSAPQTDSAALVQTISEERVVEAGCGQCLFDLKGTAGCNLAVRTEGQAFFVDGFKMADFGDPHAKGGMCEAIRQAKVTGTIENGRFAATTMEVLPVQQ